MDYFFDGICGTWYEIDNIPATPLFPSCKEMTRTYGGFFIAQKLGWQL